VAIASTRLQLIPTPPKVDIVASLHLFDIYLPLVLQDSSASLSRSPREGRPGAASLMQPAVGQVVVKRDAFYGEAQLLQRRQSMH
jgi:hypothetical protein